jgi:hypothetical protein
MNIFFLHATPRLAASNHADIHVGKMLIESCQMLATAYHFYGEGESVTYKPTHKNHPCAVWVRESALNYGYVADMAEALGREHFFRFGTHHASQEVLRKQLTKAPEAMRILPFKFTPPPLCMPDEFKTDDYVESYRAFYASKADTMDMKWERKDDNAPFWFTAARNNYLKRLQSV